jgi:hypothetical protein
MKLLKEYVEPSNLDFLVEDNGGEGCKKEKVYRIKGAFCSADEKNANNRTYPLNILKPAVDIFRESFIKRRRSLGELSHPDTPEVNFEKAAIFIESLDMVDNVGMGVARVLTDLPCGKIVAALIKENIQISVSTRGIGELKDGVVSSYVLAAIDVVQNPSCERAGYLESVTEAIIENTDWILSEGKFVKVMETSLRDLKETVDKKYNKKNNFQYLMNFLQSIQTTRS